MQKGDVELSVITLAEPRHGMERNARAKEAAERALALLLTWVPAAAFGAGAAAQYGVVTAAVRDRRRDALDRLIAAHALTRIIHEDSRIRVKLDIADCTIVRKSIAGTMV